MTTEREELIRLITEMSERDPSLRMGQLIANLATLARGPEVESIWNAEDDELAEAARRLLGRDVRQKAEVA
jgi:hypothetical protein